MRKILLKFILCTLLLMQTAFAITDSSVHKISLQDAIDTVFRENPGVQMAKIGIKIKQQDIKIANRLNNPEIHYLQQLGRAGLANTRELGMSYEIPLFKRIHLKKAAIAEEEANRYAEDFKETELTYQVKESYFKLIHHKTYAKIMEMEQNISKEILDNALREFKTGKISETDVILAKIEYNNAVMNYREAQYNVISARNYFNSIMNTSPTDYDTEQDDWNENYDKLLTISPLEDIISFEDIKQYTFKHRHDLLSVKAKIVSAKANLDIVKSQLIPDLGITGSWIFFPDYATVSGKMENGASIETRLTNIPLVHQYKPEIAKAKLEIEKANWGYKDLEIDVTRQLMEVWDQYLIARNNLNFYNKELIKNSQELERVSRNNLKKNKITMTEFLVAKQRYIDLLINYNDAFTNYHITYAKLLKEIDVEDIKKIKSDKL